MKIRSVRFNFIMNFILTASSFIFPLITFPYVSRVLGAAGTGKVAFAASIANYFVMVAALGIPTYGIRACAKVRDDREELSKTTQEILLIHLIATVLSALLYLLVLLLIPKMRSDSTLFLIEGVNIVLNFFGANWMFRALEQYSYITIRSIFFKAVSVVLMFLLVRTREDYLWYAGITVIAAAGSNIMNFIRLRRYVSFKRFPQYNLRRHLKPIFILFAQNLTVSIYTNLDTVMLGFMKDDTEVGLYSAATKMKGLLLSLVTSLGNVLLPRMSYYAEKKDKEHFEFYMKKALQFTVLASVFLAGYFVLEAKDTILLLAGKEYLGAVLAMQIITIAVIPNGMTGVIGVQVLTPLEKERYVLYSVILGAASDFFLNLLFIPEHGAAGAALATTIAEFLVLFAQMKLGWDIVRDAMREVRYVLYIGGAALGQSTCVIVLSFFGGKWPLLGRLFVIGVIYMLVFGCVLMIGKDELIEDAVRKRKHNKQI